MTLGTTEARKMSASYRLLFEGEVFDEVLIIRSEHKNSQDQEKDIRKLNKGNPVKTFILTNPENIEKIISDLNFKENSFYDYVKEKSKDKIAFVLDITGGTKLMSAAVLSILQKFKNLEKVSYITGQRSKETGKAIGAFRKEEARSFNVKFFLNFPTILNFLENKNYILLASFLDDYKGFFTSEKWRLFIELVYFYRDFLLGRFELLKSNKFLKETYDKDLLAEIVLNKNELEGFFIRLKDYFYIRYSKENLINEDKIDRALFEVRYFYDRFFSSFKNNEKILALGYFYVFFEKLLNFFLLKEDLTLPFVFNKNTFYLSRQEKIGEKIEEKIVGVKEKIDLIKDISIKRFFSDCLEKVIKRRNISIIGHGEVFPEEKIFDDILSFLNNTNLKKLFFDDLSKELTLVYPEFNLKNIFFS
jgi:hypothetical protein